MEAQGINGQLQLFEDRIMIRGRNERYFWLSEVASMRFKPAGGTSENGYIQFLYAGKVDTVSFAESQQPAFERLKPAVEKRIANNEAQQREAPRKADMEEWMSLLRDGKVSVKFAIEGGRSEVVLKENEELQIVLPNMALWEARSVRTSSGGYGGPSFRVAKGVSFRLGVFGSHSSSYEDLTEVDRGRLTLTNQRLVFTGAKRTSDIKLTKIVSVEPYEDGIAVQASGRLKTQCFAGIDPTQMVTTITINERTYPVPFTGLILDCMIEGLIKKQEETSKQSPPKDRGHDIPDQIRELGKLRDSGLITAEEFENKKKELLDRM